MRKALPLMLITVLVVLLGGLVFILSRPPKTTVKPEMFSDWSSTIDAFHAGNWGMPVEPIPSTVVDVGVLKNVPYVSWRAGDFEMNIYGDSFTPACIEVGVYGSSASSSEAQQKCRVFMDAVLRSPAAKAIVAKLKTEGDSIEADGYTFESTPPTAPDAYGAWWISVYDVKALDVARASDAEMKVLAVEVPEGPATSQSDSGWTNEQLAKARSAKVTPSTVPTPNIPTTSIPPMASSSSKSVYVSGYTKKNGTYVSSYTRSAPRRR